MAFVIIKKPAQCECMTEDDGAWWDNFQYELDKRSNTFTNKCQFCQDKDEDAAVPNPMSREDEAKMCGEELQSHSNVGPVSASGAQEGAQCQFKKDGCNKTVVRVQNVFHRYVSIDKRGQGDAQDKQIHGHATCSAEDEMVKYMKEIWNKPERANQRSGCCKNAMCWLSAGGTETANKDSDDAKFMTANPRHGHKDEFVNCMTKIKEMYNKKRINTEEAEAVIQCLPNRPISRT